MYDFKTADYRDEMKKQYGEIFFDGENYILTEDAQPTSRHFNHNSNYNDVSAGVEYQFEMSAPVVDKDNVEHVVYWLFWDIKGEGGKELDQFNYDEVDRVLEV